MSDVQALFKQALHAHQNGNFAQAQALYEQILATHCEQDPALIPIVTTTHFNLGMLFLKQGEQDAAIKQFSTVLTFHPSAGPAHLQLANLYLIQDQPDIAKHHYEAALQQQPQQVEALNNLGVVFLKQAKPDAAIEYFTKALQTNPQHKDARSNLAAILLQQDQFEGAIWHYQLFLQLVPEDSTAHYNLGVAYMALGNLAAATEQFEQTLKLAPTHVDAYCNLGAIFLKTANKEQAASCYQHAAKLAPDNAAIRYRLAALLGHSGPPAAPIEYVKNLFDNYAGYFDQHVTKELHYQLPDLIRQALTKYILPEKKWKILDLGCGTGLLGAKLHDSASHLVGIDISARMLTKAREKNIYDQLIEEDINKFITTHHEQYNLIIAADTFVYFGDLSNIFSTVPRLLATNGIFAFSTELGDHAPYQLQTTGRYTHTKSYIEQLAHDYKFNIISYREVTGREQEGKPVMNSIFILRKHNRPSS